MPNFRKEVITIEREYIDEKLHTEVWLVNQECHRDDGPAIIYYNTETGNVSCEEWFQHDLMHRDDGPAQIEYLADGTIYSMQYWVNGNQHREDGPAEHFCNPDGSVWYDGFERYWKNDREITDDIKAAKVVPGTPEFAFTWDLL